MNRRHFIKSACVIGAIAAGPALLIESCKKNNSSGTATPQGPNVNFQVDLSQPANNALNTQGGSLASNGVVVVNTGSSYIAIAQACTHAGCSISYNKSGNDFVCPCHNGVFDTNGKVVSGPPPAPLKTYTVTKNGNVLTVSG